MSTDFKVGRAALLALFVVSITARAGAMFQWQTVGAETYTSTCAVCHQPNGQGVVGTFPALAGHAPTLLAHPGGSDYLARLVLYGLEGQITANGKPFNGVMPAWGETLSDAQLAGALDYVLYSWGNDKALPPGFQPITPVDIARARSTKLTAVQVYALREQLLPPTASAPEATAPPAFTQAQVDRGHAIYRRNCQDCHGDNLDNGEFGGAPLNGQYFTRHWGDGSVAALYGYMRAKMPPDRPGKLNPQTYADLTAFLLAKNGFQPTQTELPPDPETLARMNLKR